MTTEKTPDPLYTQLTEAAQGDDVVGGFVGALTWENVGMQVANGLISGGASFVLSGLLNSLSGGGKSMEDMMLSFIDQMVDRLRAETKKIVQQEFFTNNMRMLNASLASLQSEFGTYLRTKDEQLLDDVLSKCFDIVENSLSMGVPAIGVSTVTISIKMAIFEEKSKTNPAFKKEIVNEAVSRIKQLEALFPPLLQANEQAVGIPKVEGSSKDEGNFASIVVDGVTHRDQSWDPYTRRRLNAWRTEIVTALNSLTDAQIIAPARNIMAKWPR